MIRPYRKGDENDLDFNTFSDPSMVTGEMANKAWQKYTLEDNGVKAIAAFQYVESQQVWVLVALFSKTITAVHGRALRHMLHSTAKELGARRAVTYSHDVAFINRWQKFLGMCVFDRIIVMGRPMIGWEIEWA